MFTCSQIDFRGNNILKIKTEQESNGESGGGRLCEIDTIEGQHFRRDSEQSQTTAKLVTTVMCTQDSH